MTPMQWVKGVGAATAIGVLVGVVISSGRARAGDDDQDRLVNTRVSQGFKIAPVPLNLAEKNKALVGLGSYLVNAPAPAIVAIPWVLRPNSPLLETHTFLVLPLTGTRKSIRPPTWVVAEISARSQGHLLQSTSFPAT
ncbi:MAG: hypothetical protein ACR2KT_18620 [Methylocella sp.]